MKEQIIEWIRQYFNENGPNCNAIVGISGGKDSSVCSALLVEALGKDRVIGVLMPQGYQHDMDVSLDLCKHLGIKYHIVNIGETYNSIIKAIEDDGVITKEQMASNKVFYSNTPARIRMSILYGISALYNGRVVNTGNRSEDYIGYLTKFGDAAWDFGLLNDFLVKEVKQIGYELGLPKKFIEKAPEDGLTGKTDEDNLGFTYAVLDHYIETGEIESEELKAKIERLHRLNLHKINPMPVYRKK